MPPRRLPDISPGEPPNSAFYSLRVPFVGGASILGAIIAYGADLVALWAVTPALVRPKLS